MARLDYLHSLTENGGVKFLCVARLIERKGHLHILKAVRLLLDRGVQGFKVILVGKGDLESSLMELAKKLEIEDYVDFRGYVNREVIAGVYAEADVFLLPSFNEGMSVAALEAIASGLPLLVTAESGLEGLIDNNGQVIHWGNIEELARAMEKFITNSDFRQSTGKCSMELAKNYTWNEVGNTYLELLIKSRNAVNGKINHQVI
jgi:glycosyltransferase involved in cell wall biosynthesis